MMQQAGRLIVAMLLAGFTNLPLSLAGPAFAQAKPGLQDMLFDDPDAPVAGNPRGDITIVAFLDYNCPFCRRSTADLDRYVASDPNIRVVYKDWPILAPSSVVAARIALAAKWQEKYVEVHNALMRMKGRPATQNEINQAVHAAGADIDRLNKDLETHADEIAALLKRNLAEADALQLEGTPVFLIGPFKEPQALDFEGFKQVVSDARDYLKSKPAAGAGK
ncbi:Protein-disulfide isomerase [Methylocella tundrae]|uniref:Protein-disulfide isomerase n=1 Tax=Methylocella tundrae TaxID=227605 RepID=A0A8B6M7H9_METTU|nr:DsbA family protein [Methylocella tundrae]VTZ27836.1 Protein-disulfide isomerase [Methylocella tundrae]VTZ50708.1 Protein-disulfide isomerase [Methylocella tundrae]